MSDPGASPRHRVDACKALDAFAANPADAAAAGARFEITINLGSEVEHYSKSILPNPHDSDPNGPGNFCGVTTGSDGSVFVSHSAGFFFPKQGYVDKYKPGQWKANSFPPQIWPVKSSLDALPENTCPISADGTGSVWPTILPG